MSLTDFPPYIPPIICTPLTLTLHTRCSHKGLEEIDFGSNALIPGTAEAGGAEGADEAVSLIYAGLSSVPSVQRLGLSRTGLDDSVSLGSLGSLVHAIVNPFSIP